MLSAGIANRADDAGSRSFSMTRLGRMPRMSTACDLNLPSITATSAAVGTTISGTGVMKMPVKAVAAAAALAVDVLEVVVVVVAT